jgi:hypothetical protein
MCVRKDENAVITDGFQPCSNPSFAISEDFPEKPTRKER